jgi:peptidoglycan/LPS O-acetylase OafA/YrhL
MNHVVADRPTLAAPSRTPWQVRTLTVIVALLALVTSYGAIYFSFFFEDPDPGIGSWVFVAVFLGINVTAVAAVRALAQRNETGRRVLLGYGVVGILWCVAKLVFWQETESLVFGAFNLICLGLLVAPRTRAHTR